MRIRLVTPELILLEATTAETEESEAEGLIRAVLEENGLEQWSSIELEDFTYRNSRLIFAKPVKVYIPGFLMRLTD